MDVWIQWTFLPYTQRVVRGVGMYQCVASMPLHKGVVSIFPNVEASIGSRYHRRRWLSLSLLWMHPHHLFMVGHRLTVQGNTVVDYHGRNEDGEKAANPRGRPSLPSLLDGNGMVKAVALTGCILLDHVQHSAAGLGSFQVVSELFIRTTTLKMPNHRHGGLFIRLADDGMMSSESVRLSNRLRYRLRKPTIYFTS